MSSATLIELLKRHLMARGVTYAQVATRLGLSEASVKPMFSRHDFIKAPVRAAYRRVRNTRCTSADSEIAAQAV